MDHTEKTRLTTDLQHKLQRENRQPIQLYLNSSKRITRPLKNELFQTLPSKTHKPPTTEAKNIDC